MNGFLDVGVIVTLAVTITFLLAGAVLPFVDDQRKERR